MAKKRIIKSRFAQIFVLVWYILDGAWWIIMSIWFRIRVSPRLLEQEEVIFVVKLIFENCGSVVYLRQLIFLVTDRIWWNSHGWPKQGQKKFVPPFHMIPESVWVPWLLAPKIFGYGAIYEKVPFALIFFSLPPKKRIGLLYPQFWCHWTSQ